jgi:predicted negative regulator of RcsB-dependent stress response
MKRSCVVVVASIVLLGFTGVASAQLNESDQAKPAQPASTIQEMEKYLYLVDHFARVSENPTSSGIAAVLQASEVLKDKPHDAIEFFNRALPDVKNDSVRRVIRLQLSDLYTRTNQPDKALEQLRELMILAPAVTPHPAEPAGSTAAHAPVSSAH